MITLLSIKPAARISRVNVTSNGRVRQGSVDGQRLGSISRRRRIEAARTPRPEVKYYCAERQRSPTDPDPARGTCPHASPPRSLGGNFAAGIGIAPAKRAQFEPIVGRGRRSARFRRLFARAFRLRAVWKWHGPCSLPPGTPRRRSRRYAPVPVELGGGGEWSFRRGGKYKLSA